MLSNFSKQYLSFETYHYITISRPTFVYLWVGWLLIHMVAVIWSFRSSHTEVFLGKGVLKICSKFTGEHSCRSAVSIKLLYRFIEIGLRQGCSPVNLLHIFRTPILKYILGLAASEIRNSWVSVNSLYHWIFNSTFLIEVYTVGWTKYEELFLHWYDSNSKRLLCLFIKLVGIKNFIRYQECY